MAGGHRAAGRSVYQHRNDENFHRRGQFYQHHEATSAYVVCCLTSFFKVSLPNFDHPLHTQFGKLCCFKQRQEGPTEKGDCVPRIGGDYLEKSDTYKLTGVLPLCFRGHPSVLVRASHPAPHTAGGAGRTPGPKAAVAVLPSDYTVQSSSLRRKILIPSSPKWILKKKSFLKKLCTN